MCLSCGDTPHPHRQSVKINALTEPSLAIADEVEKGAGPMDGIQRYKYLVFTTPSNSLLFVSGDELIGPLSEAEFVED